MSRRLSRRQAILTGAAATTALAVPGLTATVQAQESAGLKGNINHSVSRWCYGNFSLDELCVACKRIGIKSVELLKPNEWATVKKHGLTCAMTSVGMGIAKGFNRVENHDRAGGRTGAGCAGRGRLPA